MADELPCDSCPHAAPVSQRLTRIEGRMDKFEVLMTVRTQRIEQALFGDGTGKRGMVELVEAIVDGLRVAKSTGRVIKWFFVTSATIFAGIYHFWEPIRGMIIGGNAH